MSESPLPFLVEVGIGLIEHDQARITIKRPRQADALSHPPRKGKPAVADRRIVALWQAQDHVMGSGSLGGGDDRAAINRLKSGNVIGHGAGEQLDILRQIANAFAELVAVPLIERGAIDPDFARPQLPDAGQCPGETRFAAAGRADNRHAIAGRHAERDTAHGRADTGRRHNDDLLDLDMALWRRQIDGCRLLRKIIHQFAQPAIGAAAGKDPLPLPDNLLHRGKSPPDDDGRRHHRPGGNLLLDGQPGAGSEHAGLHGHPGKLGHGDKGCAQFRRSGIGGDSRMLLTAPAFEDRVAHAEAAHDFAVPESGGGKGRCAVGEARKLIHALLGEDFGQHRQPEQDESTDGGDRTQDRMHEVAEQHEKRCPGQITEDGHGAAGQGIPDDFGVTNDLMALPPFRIELCPHHRVEKRTAQDAFESHARTDQNARSRIFENAVEDQKNQDDQGQEDERRLVAARQDAIIDLHRVDRQRQHRGIDEHADHDSRKGARERCPHGPLKRISLVFVACIAHGSKLPCLSSFHDSKLHCQRHRLSLTMLLAEAPRGGCSPGNRRANQASAIVAASVGGTSGPVTKSEIAALGGPDQTDGVGHEQ